MCEILFKHKGYRGITQSSQRNLNYSLWLSVPSRWNSVKEKLHGEPQRGIPREPPSILISLYLGAFVAFTLV